MWNISQNFQIIYNQLNMCAWTQTKNKNQNKIVDENMLIKKNMMGEKF